MRPQMPTFKAPSFGTFARTAAVAAALTAVGCSTSTVAPPALELPPDVAERLEPLEITGHKYRNVVFWERVKYGEFRVEDVDRGWTRRESSYFTVGGERWNLVFRNWRPFAVAGAHWSWQFEEWDDRPDWVSDYGFELSQNGQPAWEGQCAMELTADIESMSCALRRLDDGKVWILALGDVGAEPVADWLPPWVSYPVMAGYLTDDETVVEIHHNIRMPDKRLPFHVPAGFSLVQGGRTVAAVDKISSPEVMWLPRTDDDDLRPALAAAGAALHLYQGLRDEADRIEEREHEIFADRYDGH
ncbi:MAG: hypothetical protein AAGD06_05500 [Acidobacteriota bacterium]